MDYATKGVGNTALGLSIGSLGAQLLSGGLNGIISGIGGTAANINGETGYITRETLDWAMKLSKSQRDNALLSAELNTEKKMVEVFNSLNDKINNVVSNQTAINSAQAVTNCAVTSQLAVLNNNVATLMGMTKTVIPNTSVCPGWGTATVTVGTTTQTA